MAAVESLRTHLIEELTDLRDAEEQLIDALPLLAAAATAKPLKTAFQKHLRETRTHRMRVDQALRELGERPTSKRCEGMKGLLSEGKTVMNKTPEGALRDAVIITGAQKVEHYEMASYGTARTYAAVLGETRVARLLQQTLKEEKGADLTLTTIAERSVNEDAADEWSAQEEEGVMARVTNVVRRAAAGVGITGPSTSNGKGRKRRTGKRTSRSRRELIDTNRDKRYVRRDARGHFKESDDVGRSLARDRKQKAKRKTSRGQGDRGDR